MRTIIEEEIDKDEDLRYELWVIEMIIRRIFHQGYPQYGPMSDNIRLDFQEEATEEVLDAIVYIALHLIKIREKRLVDELGEKKKTDHPCCVYEQEQLQQASNHCFDTTAECGSSVPVR